jgi:hypothetical protein
VLRAIARSVVEEADASDAGSAGALSQKPAAAGCEYAQPGTAHRKQRPEHLTGIAGVCCSLFHDRPLRGEIEYTIVRWKFTPALMFS